MKPPLILPSSAGDNVVNTGQTAEQAAIFLGKSGNIFRKGESLVRRDGDELKIVTPALLHTLLFSMMNVLLWAGKGANAGVVKAMEIKDSTLKAILGGIDVARYILQITIVTRCGFLVLDKGKLVDLQPGYNAVHGGVLVLSAESPQTVGVQEAVASILALFQDFKFAAPSDKSRAIAGIFNAGLRLAGIYERHPLQAYEADCSQTGKTLMFAMICAIYGQKMATVAQKVGGVGSLDEMIMEKLVTGCGFLLLDNFRGNLDSAFLEACLTPEGGQLDARVAGVRSIPVDPCHVVFGLTSNGVEMTHDLANRTMMTRVRKQAAGYDFHVWTDAEGNEVGIREHIESRQGYYHSCVNAIIRDWYEAGAKRTHCTEHSFKHTIGALDQIVQSYFSLPPLLDGHLDAMDRTTKPGLTWLRTIALIAANKWYVNDWTASRLVERCQQEGISILGATEVDDPKMLAQKVGIAMSNAFGTTNVLEIDGVRINRLVTRDSEARERKAYTFVRVPA